MAILKSTQVTGNLSVTGNLNVQGDLTYIGVDNLRVKDKQIELNATDKSGSAALTGIDADKAGIVFKGTTKEGSAEASILYDYADDSLVINKTIKGTVTSANNAASAGKVVNPLTVNVTDKTGTVKTVFDGSEAKTVDVNLKGLQDQIDGKAAADHTHVVADITDLQGKLDKKQDAFGNADVLGAITSTQVTNWDNAAGKAHEHANKAVLDGITEAKVTAWDNAVEAAGVKSVGGKTGALTLKGGSEVLGDVNLSISDTGEISAAIVPDSFDKKGAADAAKDAAIADAEAKYQVKGDYEIAGAAATAEQNAKDYADGLAVNYDAKGSAASALADAKSYTNTEIGKLGNAAQKNVLTVAIADSSSDDLVTAAQVKAYAAGVVGAMHFRGAFAEGTVIANEITNPASGDVCLVGTKEYVFNGSEWVLFGDEGAYDTKGSAAAVLGKEGDDSNVNTVYGAKAYAKKYADDLAAGKADKVHTHAIDDVTGLSDALAGKAAVSHTHTASEITDLDDVLARKQDNLSEAQLKAVDSGITATKVSDYDAHVANSDIHVTAEQKTAWSGKQDALANASTLAAITGTQVTNWDNAATKAHEHTNKKVLDGITADKVAAWDGAKNYADEKVSALSGSVATTDAAQDTKIANIKSDITSIQSDITGIQSDITGIKDGTTLDGRYVNVSGDTMTGDLTMPSSGDKGIVFGDMKIVWNVTDSAIEFIPTKA